MWQVLEVSRSPALDALKKAKRTKSLLVHPDKLPPTAVGAPQAFVRVTQVCVTVRGMSDMLSEHGQASPGVLQHV